MRKSIEISRVVSILLMAAQIQVWGFLIFDEVQILNEVCPCQPSGSCPNQKLLTRLLDGFDLGCEQKNFSRCCKFSRGEEEVVGDVASDEVELPNVDYEGVLNLNLTSNNSSEELESQEFIRPINITKSEP
jgi:hypothetical protein